jgi:hypothetical protein
MKNRIFIVGTKRGMRAEQVKKHDGGTLWPTS